MKARWIRLLSFAALCLAALGLLLGGGARADSWAMPGDETTLSANGQFRFTVTPAQVGSQLDYFRDEMAAEKNDKLAERPAPLGLLERRTAAGGWEPVWAGPLLNPVAPVEVLVADDGRHIVTFDNWHSVGHGENVIVIYGQGGALVRSLALTDLVSEDYVAALPHSVSSIQWRDREGFSPDGDSFTVDILVPGSERSTENPETLRFAITLAGGAVTVPAAEQWEAAKLAAARVNAALRQAEADRIAYVTNPLPVPQGCDKRDWNKYLREAHARLSEAPAFEASASINLLDPVDHPRHRDSIKYFKEDMLEEWGSETEVAVAAPCHPDVLVAAVSKIVPEVRPGKLANLMLYVSAPRSQFGDIVRLLGPTGARAVWIDPAASIPQRPDRIPGSPEHEAAMQAYSDGLAAEMDID